MSAPADYRFVWKPRWILSHLLVLALIVVFVNLGFWQLRRLHERQTHNARVESRQEMPSSSLGELLASGTDSTAEQIDAIVFRPVTVSGTYAPEQEVLIRNRSYEGVPGYWLVTPLLLSDGSAVAVNRGWVPFADTSTDGPWPEFAPPQGPVTVEGVVRESQTRSDGFIGGPVDSSEGRLSTLSRVDVERLDQQVPEALYPLAVDLRSQSPAQQNDLPLPVPPPELGEGNHLNYAGQWFIFATLTAIVYPLLLRRVARNKATERAGPDADLVNDDHDGNVDLREQLSADR